MNGTRNGGPCESTPTLVQTPFTFRTLAAGTTSTCAIGTDDFGYCWGSNVVGVLGRSEPSGVTFPPGRISLNVGLTQIAISRGGAHACAVDVTGDLYCWGSNSNGQLGLGTIDDSAHPTPIRVGTLKFASVAIGSNFTCGLTTDGTAYCWGGNSVGQLGDGTHVDRAVPSPVVTSLRFKGIAAGLSHACALMADGSAVCWGD
jgi:alpha-tubulin suppressor-like RCC1 family protein